MKRPNLLTDSLPSTVNIDGTEYQIHTDFRTGIRFEELMRGRRSDEEKIMGMLQMYYTAVPKDIEKAIDVILNFYSCGEEKKESKKNGPKKSQKALYSFSQDAPYIYAAFLQQYGINLNRIPDNSLHWWEFMALFESLDDDTLIRKIMYYRNVSTAGMSAKERKRILKLKELYKLEDDIPTDAKTALAKKNADMKAYIKRRVKETRKM